MPPKRTLNNKTTKKPTAKKTKVLNKPENYLSNRLRNNWTTNTGTEKLQKMRTGINQLVNNYNSGKPTRQTPSFYQRLIVKPNINISNSKYRDVLRYYLHTMLKTKTPSKNAFDQAMSTLKTRLQQNNNSNKVNYTRSNGTRTKVTGKNVYNHVFGNKRSK